MMVDFALEAERHHGHGCDGGDLPGIAAALPADSDDDDGALLSGIPLAFGSGHRVGAAQAAGRGDGRRTAVQPGADAVHDAGDLYLLRQPGRRGSRGAPASRSMADRERRNARGGRRHEPFTHLHRAAGSDDAADDRGGDCGDHRVRGAAGFAAAAGGFSDDHGGRVAAGRESGHHGVVGRDAAGAAVRRTSRA